jgi:hypothetical protein
LTNGDRIQDGKGRRQDSGDRSQKIEFRSQESEYGRQDSGDRRQKSEDRIMGPVHTKNLIRPQVVRYPNVFGADLLNTK